MLIKRLIPLVICLVSIACANKALPIKKNVDLPYLKLCLDFAEHIESDEKLLYLDGIKNFIEDYNARQTNLILRACNKVQEKSLIITVQNSRLVVPNMQAFYVVISAIGIAYPLSGGSVGFAWFAMNGTNLQMQLSPDVGGEHKPVHRYFSSWPYFYDVESLKVKHMEQFQEFMFENMEEIEKNLALAHS